jgi:hypothetical protein
MMNAGPTNEILIAAGAFQMTPKFDAFETRRQLAEKSSSILTEFKSKSLDRNPGTSLTMNSAGIWDKSAALSKPQIPSKPNQLQESKIKPSLPSRPSQSSLNRSNSQPLSRESSFSQVEVQQPQQDSIHGVVTHSFGSTNDPVMSRTERSESVTQKKKPPPPPPPKKPENLQEKSPSSMEPKPNRASVLAAKFEQLTMPTQPTHASNPSKPTLPIFQKLEQFEKPIVSSRSLNSPSVSSQTTTMANSNVYHNPFAEAKPKPSGNSIPLPPRPIGPKIPQDALARYSKLFDEYDRFSQNMLSASIVRSIWLKSQIEPKTLGKIWNMLQKTDDNQLTQKEFCIGI